MRYDNTQEYSFSDEDIFRTNGGAIICLEFTTRIHSSNGKIGRRKSRNLERIRDAVESRKGGRELYLGLAAMHGYETEDLPVDFHMSVQYNRDKLSRVLEQGIKSPAYPGLSEEIENYTRDLLLFARRTDIDPIYLFAPGFRSSGLERRVVKAVGKNRFKFYHYPSAGNLFEAYMESALKDCNGFCTGVSINNLIRSDDKEGPDIDLTMTMRKSDVSIFFGNVRSYPGIELSGPNPRIAA